MFEKVNPQHPDKVADRIAGAIVDLAYSRAFSRSGISKGPWYAARSIEALSYTKSEWPKVAAEVLLGHGQCSLQIETSERLTAEVLSPLWQGGGYKAGVLRQAKRQSRAEIKQAA